MKERPILFSAPMVRAILAGTKTQTRRIVKPQPLEAESLGWLLPRPNNQGSIAYWSDTAGSGVVRSATKAMCPYGAPGDQLWVRETWAVPHRFDHLGPSNIPVLDVRAHYAATEDRGGLLWRPSIHMCRWVSRITLEITGVRVERLQSISEADAIAEGLEEVMPGRWRVYGRESDGRDMDASARTAYCSLWESINGPGSWDANPWVWVIEFRSAST